MRRHDAISAIVLALLLAVQGVVAATVPLAPPSTLHKVFRAMSGSSPCAAMAGHVDNHKASCCDAACPDLAACALGHPALPVFVIALPSCVRDLKFEGEFDRVTSPHPSRLLRPPIHFMA